MKTKHRATHDTTISEMLFEYAELFAQNVDLDGAQLARREILRNALNKRLSVEPETFNAAMVAPMIAACVVETAKKHGNASTVLAAKGLLKLEIEHIEAKCFAALTV